MRVRLAGLVLLAAAAAGDEVHLKNGRRLSCEIVEVTKTRVTVRLPHGTLTLDRSRVDRLVREATGSYLKREAGRRLKGGSTRSAVEMYERALRDSPRDPVVRAGLVAALEAHARGLAKQYRLEDSLRALQRLLELDPDHRDARDLADWIAREADIGRAMYERALKAAEGGDFERALVALDQWRLRRPLGNESTRESLATAHVGAAQQAVAKGDLRRALDHYRAAEGYGDRQRTREPLYLLRPIAVLEALKVGDADEARRLLDGIATTYPDPAVPAFLKAVRHHVLGEVDDAVQAYASAARLAERTGATPKGLRYDVVRGYARATLRAAIARPPQEGVARWREIFLGPLVRDDSARHFVVYAPSADVAAQIAARADEAYAAIARELMGAVPAGARAEIVVHPSRPAYDAADPAPPGTPLGGVTIARGKTAGVCYRTVGEDGRELIRVETFAAPDLMANTLPHELVHVVQRRGLKVYRRGHWFDEGLATLYESETGRRNRAALWRQLKKGRIPLPEFLALKSTPPDRVSVYYNQAHALADFLRGLGDERDWRTFLGAFATGTFESALQKAYALESVELLERMWIEDT